MKNLFFLFSTLILIAACGEESIVPVAPPAAEKQTEGEPDAVFKTLTLTFCIPVSIERTSGEVLSTDNAECKVRVIHNVPEDCMAQEDNQEAIAVILEWNAANRTLAAQYKEMGYEKTGLAEYQIRLSAGVFARAGVYQQTHVVCE